MLKTLYLKHNHRNKFYHKRNKRYCTVQLLKIKIEDFKDKLVLCMLLFKLKITKVLKSFVAGKIII
ncbi:hypothetical protein ACFP3I_00795 [Chryseobacterium arachidis]|uniref:hypothetical protein n=1 Tax=Chryseobacterium arachidis TaxID=1416778 RepID=UPI000934139C